MQSTTVLLLQTHVIVLLGNEREWRDEWKRGVMGERERGSDVMVWWVGEGWCDGVMSERGMVWWWNRECKKHRTCTAFAYLEYLKDMSNLQHVLDVCLTKCALQMSQISLHVDNEGTATKWMWYIVEWTSSLTVHVPITGNTLLLLQRKYLHAQLTPYTRVSPQWSWRWQAGRTGWVPRVASVPLRGWSCTCILSYCTILALQLQSWVPNWPQSIRFVVYGSGSKKVLWTGPVLLPKQLSPLE